VLILLVALLVPVGFVLHVWNTRREGLRAVELARIASWPPEWWGLWWPRALRRPNDVWRRLPWQARLVRVVLMVFFVGLPAVILVREWLSVRASESSTVARVDAFAAAEIALVLGTALVVTGGFWWTSRRGLAVSEGARVLFGATLPAPIRNVPQVACLLDPQTGGVRPPNRGVRPTIVARSMTVAARCGRGSVGSAARHAADLVCREIERSDRTPRRRARREPGESSAQRSSSALDHRPTGRDRCTSCADLVSHQLRRSSDVAHSRGCRTAQCALSTSCGDCGRSSACPSAAERAGSRRAPVGP
jgi:hypothetical protein